MRILVQAMAAMLLVSPAMALAQGTQQQPAQQQQQHAPAAKGDYYNEIVCQNIGETGSRIAMHRVCMTRSQWAEQQRADRDEVDRAQTQRGCTKDGC